MEEKHIQMITEAIQQAKSAHHRIDEVEELIKEIRTDVKSTNQIAISVEKLATEMKAMREDAVDMNDRLKQLEQKPVKEYEETKKVLRDKVILFVAGIILTFIAFKLGLKDFL